MSSHKQAPLPGPLWGPRDEKLFCLDYLPISPASISTWHRSILLDRSQQFTVDMTRRLFECSYRLPSFVMYCVISDLRYPI